MSPKGPNVRALIPQRMLNSQQQNPGMAASAAAGLISCDQSISGAVPVHMVVLGLYM